MFRLPDRGSFGYFDRKKKINLIATVVSFLIVAIIFFTGVILYHNNKSVFTVIATVAVLPAAKMLIAYIMVAPYTSVSKERYEEIVALQNHHAGCDVLCDVLLASKESAMIAGMVAICDGHILMFSDSKKAVPVQTEQYVKTILQNSKYTSLKMYTEYEPFRNRIKQLMGEVSEVSAEQESKKDMMCERVAHDILVYAI